MYVLSFFLENVILEKPGNQIWIKTSHTPQNPSGELGNTMRVVLKAFALKATPPTLSSYSLFHTNCHQFLIWRSYHICGKTSAHPGCFYIPTRTHPSAVPYVLGDILPVLPL